MNQSMWALRLHERGGPEQLAYEQAPCPSVGIGDALVRVHAASFTPTELSWPSTWVDHAGRDRRPSIPAHEVSGVVEALGYGTIGVAVGQAVYGLTDWYRDGAAAEYVAVEARNLAPKPASLSHVDAAAVPLAGLTAWQALFDPAAPWRARPVTDKQRTVLERMRVEVPDGLTAGEASDLISAAFARRARPVGG